MRLFLKALSIPLLHQGGRWFRHPIPWLLLAAGIAIAVLQSSAPKGLLAFAVFFALIGCVLGIAVSVRWMMKRKLAGNSCPVCRTRLGEKGADRAFAEYTAKCQAFAKQSEGFFSIDHGFPMDLSCPDCGRRLWFSYMGDGVLSVENGSLSLEGARRLGLPLRNEVFSIPEEALRKLAGEERAGRLPIQCYHPVPLAEMDPTPSTFYFGEPISVVLQVLFSDPPSSPRPDRILYAVLLAKEEEADNELRKSVEAFLRSRGLESTRQGLEEFREGLADTRN